MKARRTNLLDLAGRPGRFEHHLAVVARAGGAQLEVAAASEPLYFGHVNISDEYALALPTGDPVVDGFPMRTFVSDAATLEDVGRYNHRVGDIVLHPSGALHWPGRLRPPYAPIPRPPGRSRCAVSLVFCASSPVSTRRTSSSVTAGRDADAKRYVPDAPTMVLRDLLRDGPGLTFDVAGASLELVSGAGGPCPRGAYVVVLDAEPGSSARVCDIVHVPAGQALEADGVRRALLFTSASGEVEPPPPSWDSVPPVLLTPFDAAGRRPLPVSHEGLLVKELDAGHVTVSVGLGSAVVPRYWLARMLFRVALHRPLLGYVETYGGFFFDDREPDRHRLGVRGRGEIALPAADAMHLVEMLYRAVAPAGYSERRAD